MGQGVVLLVLELSVNIGTAADEKTANDKIANEKTVIEGCLADVEPGEGAYIKRLDIGGTLRRRLLDLGLVQGTWVECVGKSPLGDPAAYLIRGAVIALRAADCAKILVRRE